MLCNTNDTVTMALNALRSSSVRVMDVETSGLLRWSTHIVGYVFTVGLSPEDTFYIPIRHAGGGNLPGCSVPETSDGWDGTLHPVESEIARIMSDPRSFTIGHNLQFDLWHSRRHGIRVAGRMADTMVTQSLINEHMRSFSLESCCEYMRVQGKKGGPLYEYLAQQFGGDPIQKQMGSFWRTDAREFVVHDYATGDGTSTLGLHNAQMEVVGTGMEQIYDIESRVIPIIHEMIWRGVRVDEARLAEVKEICERKLSEALNSLPSGLNLRSSIQIKKMFDEAGITDYPKTDKGNASFTEKYLNLNPLGRKVVAAREFDTLLDSFISPVYSKHLQNGRVHPWYNQSRDDQRGTITGRFSSSEPNVQQVPKRKKVTGRLIRSIFIPDEGKVWGSVDYSQCEPTLLAHFMCRQNPENVLAQGYRQDPPVDSHTAVANAAGIDRESAKRLNQGIITGAGKAKIISEMQAKGKSPAQAVKVYDDYFIALPELRPLQKEMAHVYRSRQYLRTLLGRRAHLDDPRFDYKALNRALQGGNADILKLKMVEVSDYLATVDSGVDLLTNIHDSFDYQFYAQDRGVYEECLRIMTAFGPEDVIPLRVPLRVDSDEGHNWAVATYGDDCWEKAAAELAAA